jgi:hypothetical protein
VGRDWNGGLGWICDRPLPSGRCVEADVVASPADFDKTSEGLERASRQIGISLPSPRHSGLPEVETFSLIGYALVRQPFIKHSPAGWINIKYQC